MKFRVRFLQGQAIVAEVVGSEVSPGTVTIEDSRRVIEAEDLLGRLTHLRVHIDWMEE